MQIHTYRTTGSSIQYLHEKFVKIGLDVISEPHAPISGEYSRQDQRMIARQLPEDMRNTKEYEIDITKIAEYKHLDDEIRMLDYEVRRLYKDPIVIVYEEVPNRTSPIVEEAILSVVLVDVVTCVYVYGSDSSQFTTAVSDAARILGADYRKFSDVVRKMLIKTSARAMKSLPYGELQNMLLQGMKPKAMEVR